MNYEIIPLRPEFDAALCRIIKSVGEEFDATAEGYGPADAEVQNMSQHYREETNSLYLVALINNEVVGGCGVAAFNADAGICELRKLFLLRKARGLGIGKILTLKCLEFARSRGFKRCYLETLSSMQAARSIYEKLGFEYLNKAFEGSIHSGCNVWMIKKL